MLTPLLSRPQVLFWKRIVTRSMPCYLRLLRRSLGLDAYSPVRGHGTAQSPLAGGTRIQHFGVYLNDIVCDRVSPPVKASYLAVLFENFTDPITTGREELGFPKVFAEIPNANVTIKVDGRPGQEEKRVHTVSWDGYEFLRLELSGLASWPVVGSPALTAEEQAFTHPTRDGILHQRYIPAVGEPGKADADYATFCPPPSARPTVLQFKTFGSEMKIDRNHTSPARIRSTVTTTPSGAFDLCHGAAKLEIKRGTFEQLPTLHNIVDKLAALEITGCRQVALQEFKGASDLGECLSLSDMNQRYRTPS